MGITCSEHQSFTDIPLERHSAIFDDHSCIRAASFNSCTPVAISCPSCVSRLLEISRDGFGHSISQNGAYWQACVIDRLQANRLNPEAYLNHLLSVLPERFAGDPQAKVDDLMPWDKEMQRRFRG